jgi:hypothetical protein
MGVPRLTPGESVDALDEAVKIIRGLWDEAERGPAPAHTIPIWVGAQGPRMLRLIGRAADGRLPSLPFVRRERRRSGIDYDAVPGSLRGTAVEPGDAGYARVRSTYMRGGSPGLVLRPRTPAQVAEALAFARAQPVKMAVRSGGHGIRGRSTSHGGIGIDVGALDGIEVIDKETRRVRIGPGARWRDVAAALAPHGWALSSGDYGGVGVGGLATSTPSWRTRRPGWYAAGRPTSSTSGRWAGRRPTSRRTRRRTRDARRTSS